MEREERRHIKYLFKEEDERHVFRDTASKVGKKDFLVKVENYFPMTKL